MRQFPTGPRESNRWYDRLVTDDPKALTALASMKSQRNAFPQRVSPSTAWLVSEVLTVDLSDVPRTPLVRDLLQTPVTEIAMSGEQARESLLRSTNMARHPLNLAWLSPAGAPFLGSSLDREPVARFVDASGPRLDVSARLLRLVWDLLGGGWDRATSEGHGRPLAFWRLGRPMAFLAPIRNGLPPVPAGHPLVGHDLPRTPPSPKPARPPDALPMLPEHPQGTPRVTRHSTDLALLAGSLGAVPDRFAGYDWCFPTRGGALRVGVGRDGHLRGRFDDPAMVYAATRYGFDGRLPSGPLDLYAGLHRGVIPRFLGGSERDEVGLLGASLDALGIRLAPGDLPPSPLEAQPPASFGPHYEVEPEDDARGRPAWRIWDIAKAAPVNGLTGSQTRAELVAERLSHAACLARDALGRHGDKAPP